MFVVLAVLVVTGAAITVVSRGPSVPTPTTTALKFGPAGPTVDTKAFTGEGDLAFVSRGALFVLDGTTRSLDRPALPGGLVPSAPTFSADGQWLAFTGSTTTSRLTGNQSTQTSLWLARADGAGAHRVAGFDDPQVIGWSPRQDLLAVTNQGTIPTTFNGPRPSDRTAVRQTSLWLLSPSGSRRLLVRTSTGEIDGGAWSPDGSAIAVGSLSAYPFGNAPWSTLLVAYPIDGSAPTTWFRILNPRSNSCCSHVGLIQSQFIPVGWWRHWGVVFWAPTVAGDDGSGLVGGGFPLYAIPASGDKPIPLGRTLADGQVSPIVASSNGDLAISGEPIKKHGTRPFWQNEQVDRCSPTTLHCIDVAEPPGTISFDPVWSPAGSSLAYLVGKVSTDAGFDQQTVADWYNSLQLWVFSAKTGKTSDVTAARGAVVPLWSADSRSLLYVGDDGVWLLKSLKSKPVEVAGPLLPPKDWNAYFAQVDWAPLFGWSRS